MKVEQRIGRVDRIGQPHVVRAINFVLEDTVEHRVREVLETKLEVIAREFGVDKASDVMDSVEAEAMFDDVFARGLQDPASIDRESDVLIDRIRERVSASQESRALLSDAPRLDADAARKWRDHPAQYWLERAITHGLAARGGGARKEGDAWWIRWADGSESVRVCFDARTAEQEPDMEWVTLEDPRARALISDVPRCVPEQPVPVASITGLPSTVQGVWSLWEIGLSADGFTRRRFLPVFLNDEGRAFVPTAKRIWDLLLTEHVELGDPDDGFSAGDWHERSLAAARGQGEAIFASLVEEHRSRLSEERERARYAFEARYQAIGRIGLPAVREFRRKRLDADYQARLAALDEAATCTPELSAVLLLRFGNAGAPG